MILLHNDNIDIHNILMLFKILLSLHSKSSINLSNSKCHLRLCANSCTYHQGDFQPWIPTLKTQNGNDKVYAMCHAIHIIETQNMFLHELYGHTSLQTSKKS
jgi:hypothetical protein